jgi:hypothetical protein
MRSTKKNVSRLATLFRARNLAANLCRSLLEGEELALLVGRRRRRCADQSAYIYEVFLGASAFLEFTGRPLAREFLR